MNCPKCNAEMIRGRKGWMCEECGERISTQADPEPERTLVDSLATAADATSLREGRYAITETLGKGGMGIVHRAIDTQLRRAVAIKGILPEMLGVGAAEQRFLREAQAIASIEHENVIRIYDYFAEDQVLYIVMEFFEGLSLHDYVHQVGTPDAAKVKDIFGQIVSALATVHAKGLVHRDIKPSNILINPQGRVRLIDFGLVRGEGTLVTRSGAYLGTPGYTAPEQELDAASADARADIYSLGGALYFCVTGGKHPPRVLLPEGVPQAYRHVVLKALAASREERFADVKAFASALGIGGSPPAPPKEEPQLIFLEEPEPPPRAVPATPPPTPTPTPRPAPAAPPPQPVPTPAPAPLLQQPKLTDDIERWSWDANYWALAILGLFTLWIYPIVRMQNSLVALNGKVNERLRNLLGREIVFPAARGMRNFGVFNSIVGILTGLSWIAVPTACEFRVIHWSDFDEFAVGLAIATGLFYLGTLIVLFCWFRALQKSEYELLKVCSDTARSASPAGKTHFGEGFSSRWGWRWFAYVLYVLTAWFPLAVGVIFHFGGMQLFLLPLRRYAGVADRAHRDLAVALSNARR